MWSVDMQMNHSIPSGLNSSAIYDFLDDYAMLATALGIRSPLELIVSIRRCTEEEARQWIIETDKVLEEQEIASRATDEPEITEGTFPRCPPCPSRTSFLR